MDVRSLRQVVAIWECGSFAKAAETLGMSQPSLSKSIARLEDELRLKIFERSSQGAVLTPVGELIVERAGRVIRETRDLARDAALLAGGETGGVRIGCTPTLQDAFLQPLLTRIVSQHPRLRIHLELATGDRLLPLLESRELDLVFSATQPLAEAATAFFIEPFLAAPAIFVASPTHPLASEADITLERLAEFRCGGSPSSRFGNAALLDMEDENLGMYTASNYDVMIPIIVSGDAILLAPSVAVQKYIESGALVVLDTEWRQTFVCHLMTTRAASFSPMLRKICGYAHELGDRLRHEWSEMEREFAPKLAGKAPSASPIQAP